MTERLLLAAALAAVAVGFAATVRRRRPDPPTAPAPSVTPPVQVDRADFDRPAAPWLVAVFTSATCSTCSGVWAKAQVLSSDDVVVQEIEVSERPDLHERYGIDAVPITLIADDRGVVGNGFAGPVSSTHLWAALAELREPGSVPPGCAHPDD